MKQLELDIINNLEEQKKLSKLSIIILIVSIVPFIVLEFFSPSWGESAIFFNETVRANFGFYGILISVILAILVLFLILVLHEGIHGLFFKVFSPNGKVKFGFKSGMAYATSPGNIFTRTQFVIIILAPFIVITSLLILMMFTLPHGSYKYILILHTSACAGDFYYVHLIMKHPHLKYCEDTLVGMSLHSEKPV